MKQFYNQTKLNSILNYQYKVLFCEKICEDRTILPCFMNWSGEIFFWRGRRWWRREWWRVVFYAIMKIVSTMRSRKTCQTDINIVFFMKIITHLQKLCGFMVFTQKIGVNLAMTSRTISEIFKKKDRYLVRVKKTC